MTGRMWIRYSAPLMSALPTVALSLPYWQDLTHRVKRDLVCAKVQLTMKLVDWNTHKIVLRTGAQFKRQINYKIRQDKARIKLIKFDPKAAIIPSVDTKEDNLHMLQLIYSDL